MPVAVNMFPAGAFTSDTCLTITATLRTGQTLPLTPADHYRLGAAPGTPTAHSFTVRAAGSRSLRFNEACAGPAFPPWSSWSLIKQMLVLPHPGDPGAALGTEEPHVTQGGGTKM